MTFSAAFYKSTRPGLAGIYNRLIRWWDNGKYSHCELIFSDGRAASASYLDGGVRFKQIDFRPERWDFILLPDYMEDQARQWFIDHEGDKYDLIGNLRFALDFLPDNKNKWFCSEALAAAIGISEPWRLGPNGLAAVLNGSAVSLRTAEENRVV
jgi:hypothetical protein